MAARVVQIPPGTRFGRLVTSGAYVSHPNGVKWDCVCDCGTSVRVSGSGLRKGTSSSCGCLQRERLALGPKALTKHGATKGYKCEPEYLAWAQMWARCTKPAHKSYLRYGGRGISVCAAWRDYTVFLSDVGTRPSADHSIDRYPNNDGDYEPGNVRWATRSQQNRNQRRTRRLTHEGETLSLDDWAERLGVPRELIRSRLRTGWDTARALTEPKGAKR